MGTLTKKQFDRACKPNLKKYAEWISNHPVEYTDEWIYEYEKMKHLGKGWGGGFFPIGTSHEGVDEPVGLYHYMSYDQDE